MTTQAFAELGLQADATDAQVKAAWRRLVSRWHPDRNPNAQALARVQRINQAFEAIRRARGHDAAPVAEDEQTPAPSPAAEPAAPTDEADDNLGTASSRVLRRKLTLTLEEAAFGCIKSLRGRSTPTCGGCAGAGHRVLGTPCRSCRGKGTVVQASAWFGWPGASAPCAACEGSGVAREVCADCAGSGKGRVVAYQVQVRIPPGVRDGDVLHVAARRARRSPAPADIEVQVRMAAHPLFRLEKDGNLCCELPVNGYAWMAQRTVQVPTLEGLRPLALRRAQQCYRLPGLGFPQERGTSTARGDLVVHIVPEFPEQPSPDQDILLDQLIATSASPRLKAWQHAVRAWEKDRGR